VVNGVAFSPGIRDNDDVETVLRYVVEQYAARVEPLVSPGCWGYSYRPNRNDPNSLSNHASGTAVDINAPQHPNAVPTWRTFTAAQQAEVHSILTDLNEAVRWGGDYQRTADAMHFEIVCGPEHLHAVAEKLRENNDMTPDQARQLDEVAAKVDAIHTRLDDIDKVLRRITKAKREVISAVEDQP